MHVSGAQVWHVIKVGGGSLLGLAVFFGAVVGIWVAFGLPQVAWSTDIERLERSQIRLSISFQRERSVNILDKIIIVESNLYKEKSKPQDQQLLDFMNSLNSKLRLLEDEK